MKRGFLIVVAMNGVLGGAAFAQQTAPSANGSTQQRPLGPIPIERPTLGELMTANGGSLLRATLAASPDPSVATLKQVSFFAVPDPEPRTMKKHDLVTIIIREESEITSDGTSDLKKNADLDMRVDEFIKLQAKNFAIKGGAQGASPPAIKLPSRSIAIEIMCVSSVS